ncbi:MAG: phospholipid carrier-dependent glycosyltransferase, partial [Alphaproteobacteria bacterium]|nr:phospholipid carrier-dependent glycosyltransferase [Alphaproteobacteria bacterium]
MLRYHAEALWAAAAMAATIAVALALRPLWPLDETRYLSVAWEMWQRGEWLVPYLNGEPYSHKPPLLFWLIQAGWLVLGPVELWARLVAPLCGLACLPLVAALARRLWPAEATPAVLAPWLLVGCLLWPLMGTLTMFDALLVLSALTAAHGILAAASGRATRGWLLFGAALGLGVLAKGPIIALFTLPPALLAPLWFRTTSWRRWYLGAAGGAVLGIGLALAWAIPAALAGGEAYARAILWGQTSGRIVESFAHQRPAWWYLVALPAVALPWSAWPAVWRALSRRGWGDTGLRLCLVWGLGALVGLSLISGKQPHYLMPLLPALALILARRLGDPGAPEARRVWLPSSLFAAAGLAALALIVALRRDPGLVADWRLPAWAASANLLGGLGLAAGALAA